tara:strand:+ start:169 stop:936 length:768 start_codon:yes stop_codon:yes gene_type:complete
MRAFIIFLALLLSGCTTYQVSTTGHDPIYAVNVPSNINIDTLNYRQFQWKLRTDFQFRFDFARYAMNQPYSWYMSNFNFNRWRPYNSFDIYFNSTQYWTNWAFNYPFHSNPYGWDNWNRPYSWGYSYSNWYNGPWSNQGYNAIWNRSGSVSYINGRRGLTTTSNRMPIKDKIALGKISQSRLVTNKPVIVNKSVVNINKPIVIWKQPIKNDATQIMPIKPRTNYIRPSYNTPIRNNSVNNTVKINRNGTTNRRGN